MAEPDELAQFAARLREARKAAGLTQTELAQACGVRLTAVSRWELGTAPPNDPFVLLRAAQAVKRPVGWLLGEPDVPTIASQEEAIEAGVRLYARRLLEVIQQDLQSPAVFEFPDSPRVPLEPDVTSRKHRQG